MHNLAGVEQIPPEFLKRFTGLLQDEFEDFLESQNKTSVSGIRLNTLKLPDYSLLTKNGIADCNDPVPWCPAGFTLKEHEQPGKHPYHSAGLYYLQEPSAMAVAEILSPQPGERILDISAAPGGKSTHIITLMQNQGLLVSNEIHPQRVWELAGNLERWGAQNTVILRETPERLAIQLGAFFDRVLLDAPCSGEGMFRKSQAARRDWSPELVLGCALRQSEILHQASRLVRPGGWLVYSTCTFNPDEDEAVIAQFISLHPDFEISTVATKPGFSPGRADWLIGVEPNLALQRTVRLWPHLTLADGHFIALLHKEGDDSPAKRAVRRIPTIDRHSKQLFEAFQRDCLTSNWNPLGGTYYLAGSYLYLVQEDFPDSGSLKAIHPGWWLGTFKKDRFEPSHALALGLRPEHFNNLLNLTAGGAEILAYLRGEPLYAAGDDGWVLVCVDGFPTGWGKRKFGVVKNLYPRGLRRIK